MKKYFLSRSFILGTALALVNVPKLPAQDDAADLAKQLQNPVAALISVPFQSNFDWGGGPEGDGFQYKLNIQPVVPIGLNDDWNLISRTILPYIYQEDVIGWGSQSGLSDTVQSLFFSPRHPLPLVGFGVRDRSS
ncbi:MAG: hypothetical protein R3F31_16270 [Verrucomicrobiales bacterium]